MELMSERVLGVGDVLLVSFPLERLKIRGKEVLSSRVYFFKISFASDFYSEWDKMPVIAAKSGTDFGYFGENGFSSGKDILRIERDDFHVYHFFLTHSNPYVRVYKTVSPIGNALSSLDRKSTIDLPDPKKGSPHDFYTLITAGGDRFNPNTLAENLVFRTADRPDGKGFFWGFYNPTSEDIPAGTPVYLIGKGYKLIPITDVRVMERMLTLSLRRELGKPANRITKIAVGDVRRGYFTAEKFIPSAWNELGCFLSLDERRAALVEETWR